jgi:hypothetical protein
MRARTGVAAALGVGLAAVVVAMLRARVLVDRSLFSPQWTNAVGLATASAALALSLVVRSRRRAQPPRLIAALVAGLLGGLAVATYWGLGNDVVRFHRPEHFHYYLGAKYFPELSYSRLYACVAVVEAERVGRASMGGRRMRDLASDEVVPVGIALSDPAACTKRFTPDRWRAFGDDVMFFREALGPLWDRMNQDHGFNAPPGWALTGHALVGFDRASDMTQTRLALLDPSLLVAAFALVGWAFGAHVLWVALVVWGCQVPAQGTWTAGAFLRQDWLFCVVAAACFARRGWFLASGVALASAAALRIFPGLLLIGPIVVIGRRAWRVALGRGDRRFVAGAVLGGLAWLVASTVVFGLDAWPEFASHLAVHRLAPLANHVGLRALLSQSWDGRWVEVMKPGAVDPFRTWATLRRETFAAHGTLYVALAAAFALLAIAGTWRVRRIWVGLAASTVLVVTAVDVASYYCAIFVLLALLAADDRRLEWLALAAVVASRATNALPIAVENPDLRYTVQSGVFVAWGAAALALLAWARSPLARDVGGAGRRV